MSTAIDPQLFRDVLGHYPTGVSVVTAHTPGGAALAMVVGTFTSVSLDPPLIAFLPSKQSSSFAALREAEGFAVNIVAHDQEDLVRRLSRSDPDKMDHEQWVLSDEGNPVLTDAVAVVECTPQAVHEAGDHFIVVGRVRALRTIRPTIPLLFFRGGYGEFTPRSLVAPDGRGLSGAVAQARALRDRIEQAAADLGGEVAMFARIAGDTVALAAAARGEQLTPLGARYPLVPPVGAQYLAWSDDREIDVWLDRAAGATDAERSSYRRHLDDARAHGWSVSIVPDDAAGWTDDIPSVPDPSMDAAHSRRGRHAAVARRMAQSVRTQDVGTIDPASRYRVISFMAPIFATTGGAPELMVRLLLFPTEYVSGEAVLRRGAAVKTFADDCGTLLRHRLSGAP